MFQVDRELIIADLVRSPHQLRDFILAEADSQKPILRAVIGKDVCERRRNYGAKSEIRQRPHRMLARGAAAKIPSGNQNARALVAWLVQNKIGMLPAVSGGTPIVKQELSKAGALDPL